MALIKWSSSHSLGEKEIDEQHRRLANCINELHDAMMQGEASDLLNGLLDRLLADARKHFQIEEKIMLNSGYPEFGAHRLEHEEFLKTARDLRSRHRTGEIFIHGETLQFLADWLTRHDLERDRHLVKYHRDKRSQSEEDST